MASLFDRHGIRFLYPEGWQVIEEQPVEGASTVTVQSASGAFWSVSSYSHLLAPDQLLEQALEAMQQEYEGLEVDSARREVAGNGTTGYDLSFFYLDFLITARMLAWRQGSRTLLVLYQAESREFEAMEEVFTAINTSLIREIGEL